MTDKQLTELFEKHALEGWSGDAFALGFDEFKAAVREAVAAETAGLVELLRPLAAVHRSWVEPSGDGMAPPGIQVDDLPIYPCVLFGQCRAAARAVAEFDAAKGQVQS